MILTNEQLTILKKYSWAGLVFAEKATNLDIGDVIKSLAEEALVARAEIDKLKGIIGNSEDAIRTAQWDVQRAEEALETVEAKVEELNKQIEEANAARAQDQQRLFHYERLLSQQGIADPAACVDVAMQKFAVGARVIYNLGHNGETKAFVVSYTKKRVRIQLVGRGYSSTRHVMEKTLRIDPNPDEQG